MRRGLAPVLDLPFVQSCMQSRCRQVSWLVLDARISLSPVSNPGHSTDTSACVDNVDEQAESKM